MYKFNKNIVNEIINIISPKLTTLTITLFAAGGQPCQITG